MLKIRGRTIRVDQGDAVSIAISFRDNPPDDGTEVRFCVKDFRKELIVKTLTVAEGKMELEMDSGETNIPEGTYEWGLYVRLSGPDGYAPIASASFEVGRSTAYPGAVIL